MWTPSAPAAKPAKAAAAPKVEAAAKPAKAATPKAAAAPKAEGAAKPAAAAKTAEAKPAKAAAAPKAAAKPKAEAAGLLSAPRGGTPDDLKVIEGVGPAMEKILHSVGVYHFDQIAKWTKADIAAVDAKMDKFKGRIERDKWVAQAKIIVKEGVPAFLERAKTNNY